MAYEFRTTRRIEFSDTDLAGIVHFARFFAFMETAEHEFLRSLGLSVLHEADGIAVSWPRLAARCEYFSPAHFEELIDIHLKVVRKGTKSLTYSFLFSRDGQRIARGEVSAACCLHNPGEPLKAIPIPAVIADKIDEAPPEEESGDA